MSAISAPRRELYGLVLGLFLLADLGGGAAAVVARAGGPDAAATPKIAPTTDLSSPPPEPPSPGRTDCGEGPATARVVVDRTDTGYVLRATVANDSNRTVELDRLVVRAKYSDGSRTFDAAIAGHWIRSGVPETDFAVPGSASVTAPASLAVTDFAFHTAGLAACTAR